MIFSDKYLPIAAIISIFGFLIHDILEIIINDIVHNEEIVFIDLYYKGDITKLSSFTSKNTRK